MSAPDRASIGLDTRVKPQDAIKRKGTGTETVEQWNSRGKPCRIKALGVPPAAPEPAQRGRVEQ
jgi:hypothetical protein